MFLDDKFDGESDPDLEPLRGADFAGGSALPGTGMKLLWSSVRLAAKKPRSRSGRFRRSARAHRTGSPAGPSRAGRQKNKSDRKSRKVDACSRGLAGLQAHSHQNGAYCVVQVDANNAIWLNG